MTAEYALDYIVEIETHFNKRFDYEELNVVWGRIMLCSDKAGAKAKCLAILHKKMISGEQYARMVEKQHTLLTLGVELGVVKSGNEPVKMPDSFKAAMKAINLM